MTVHFFRDLPDKNETLIMACKNTVARFLDHFVSSYCVYEMKTVCSDGSDSCCCWIEALRGHDML